MGPAREDETGHGPVEDGLGGGEGRRVEVEHREARPARRQAVTGFRGPAGGDEADRPRQSPALGWAIRQEEDETFVRDLGAQCHVSALGSRGSTIC
ncbi:hypothetical protein [Methylobacterium gregans]|uniref:hypothetical protein n=1 Tax=Methylobacterium gregans TaxID=374424 RepID=UPI00235C7DDA|nr:hypothetical protein GCM10007886_19990 [Methylobacterium gregans]